MIEYQELTPMEKRIYRAIVFEGLDIPKLADKFCLQRCTIIAHLNHICFKLVVTGSNRVQKLQSEFWENFMEQAKWNCSLCQFNNGRCMNPDSQFYKENLTKKEKAENMVCGRFRGKKKNCYSKDMADCVDGFCEGCRFNA